MTAPNAEIPFPSIGPEAVAAVQAAPPPQRTAAVTSLASRIRAAGRASHPFTLLHTTPEPIDVYVQRPSLVYLMSNGLVPSSCKELVNDLTRDRSKRGVTSEQNVQNVLDERGAEMLELMGDLLRATAIAGWVNPELVASQHELVDSERQMLVTEIDQLDLERYFTWCQGEDAADFAAVKSSPREESPAVAVDDGSEGEAVRDDSEQDESGAGLAARSDQI